MPSVRCEVCHELQSKYCCPGCSMKTCSLKCVKQHKSQSECKGVRDKTAFISVPQFTDMHLKSDYGFLEDACRMSDSAQRDLSQFDDKNVIRKGAKKFINKLLNAAKGQGVTLKLMPSGMERRRMNSTVYSNTDKAIYWHIEFVFPQFQAKYSQRRVSENSSIEKLLEIYLHPAESDPVIRHKLRDLVKEGMEGVCVLMKVEEKPACSPKFYEIDAKKSLIDNLRGKVVIEFPTMIVVKKTSMADFDLLSEDKSESEESSEESSTSEEEEEVEEEKEEEEEEEGEVKEEETEEGEMEEENKTDGTNTEDVIINSEVDGAKDSERTGNGNIEEMDVTNDVEEVLKTNSDC